MSKIPDKSTSGLHAERDISKLRVMQSNDSKPAKYAMSVGAASIAETVTYPLDLTKTRLQLQGEIAAGEKGVQYRGMFQTAFGIFKEEVTKLNEFRSMTARKDDGSHHIISIFCHKRSCKSANRPYKTIRGHIKL